MAVRAAIVVFLAVLILLFALAALGYSYRLRANPPTVPPPPPDYPDVR
jgi:hypothetical protein